MRGYGYDRIVVSCLSGPLVREGHPPILATTYPQDWVAYYDEQDYYRIDPVIPYAATSRGPVLWEDMAAAPERSDIQRAFFAEAREAGLHQGLIVPLHGPQGELLVVSLASEFTEVDPKDHLREMQALTLQFHADFVDKLLPGGGIAVPFALSDREKECLLWSARGKSSWDIGLILGVSEHTVNFHMKNALNKLGCSNRVVGVVKAVRLGLIVP